MTKRHWAFKDISGQIFGRLTVVNQLPKGYGDTTKAMWECNCSCGNKTISSGVDLRLGQSTSCGCLRREKTSILKRKEPYRWIYNGLVKRCHDLRRECNLSFEEFLSFTKVGKCSYCQSPIDWVEHRCNRESSAYHLDRKDSFKGYTKDNCVVCCSVCNWVKSDIFSHSEMLELGATIQNILKQRKV